MKGFFQRFFNEFQHLGNQLQSCFVQLSSQINGKAMKIIRQRKGHLTRNILRLNLNTYISLTKMGENSAKQLIKNYVVCIDKLYPPF